MTRTQFEKRLVQEKIRSHRAVLRVELEAMRQQLKPASLLVAWSKRWSPLSKSIEALTRALGIDERGRWGRWVRYGTLAALALPLIQQVVSRNR